MQNIKLIITNTEALRMQLIPKATIDQIKLDEGLKLKPYKCTANKLTIGYGRNIEDNGITEAEAEMLLMNDIRNIQAELLANFEWFSMLNASRQSVLMNMCFNLGMPRLLKFKKMIIALSKHDYKNAAIEMIDSRWAVQVGERANRLASIMINGNYE